MPSEIVSMGALGAGIVAGGYQAAKIASGEWVTAIAVPLIGVGINQAGVYFRNGTLENLGASIVIGTTCVSPGAYVGGRLYSFMGNTFCSVITACIAGVATTTVVFEQVMQIVAQSSE